MKWLKSLFSWLAGILSGERARQIKAVFPHAIAAVEYVSGFDWNGDGAVATRETAMAELVAGISKLDVLGVPWVGDFIYRYEDGSADVNSAVLSTMPTVNLKMWWTIVRTALAVLAASQALPSFSILDSAKQLAFEKSKN